MISQKIRNLVQQMRNLQREGRFLEPNFQASCESLLDYAEDVHELEQSARPRPRIGEAALPPDVIDFAQAKLKRGLDTSAPGDVA